MTASAFFGAVALAILAYGSAAAVPLNLAEIVFALLTLASMFRPIVLPKPRRVHSSAILVLAALLGYAAFQALAGPVGEFANGAWKSAAPWIGPVSGTISVAPGMTREALATLALPFLVFLCALALFQRDEEALFLWRMLAHFGTAYAVFGIAQEVFVPDQVVLAKKSFYLGSVTASFINRNTAGTFFGVALLLNLGLLFRALKRVPVGSFFAKALDLEMRWRDESARVVFRALSCLIVAVALFMTQSRGAVGATFIGAAVGVVMMTRRRLTRGANGEKPSRWRRHAGSAVGMLIVLGAFAAFSGRSVYRLQEAAGDDARWCSFASTLRAIEDYPVFGTGFGAFQDVFPAYRTSDCAGISGVWDRAHNFFLEGYLGLGAPFLIALIFGYGVLGVALIRGSNDRRRERFAPVMALAALVLTTIHSIVDFSLQIPGFAVYFAATMAAGVTISLQKDSARVTA